MLAVKRIKIRHKRLSDAKEDYAWQTDSELAQLDATVTLKMSYQQYLSEYTFELCYPSPHRHEFAIETPDGKHIGNCVYYNVNPVEGKAELGIMIGDRRYWNQGYGTETVRAFLDYIFNRTPLEKISLTTLDWNVRAQRCFKKCGFSEHGQLVRDNQTFLQMAIHREEWNQFNNADTAQPAISVSAKQEGQP
jgi:ribosomal-protein-alanine N-acetyltransferase